MSNISNKFATIEDNNKKINSKLNSDYKNSVDQGFKAVSDSRQLNKYSLTLVGEIENSMNVLDPDLKREYTMKIKNIRDEINLKSVKINKLEEKLNSTSNLNKFKNGETNDMSDEQIKKATKDAAVDLNLKADMHQELIGEIGKNLYASRDNLNACTVEIDKQGNQIDKIYNDVGDTQKIVGRTDKRITSMNRRVYCHKLLLNMLAFVLFVACMVILVIKLTRK